MKQMLMIALFVTTFGGSSLFTDLWYREDDLSLRYNLWKVGLWSQPDRLVWSLVADGHGAPLKGMTRDEIKTLFPGAHEGPGHGEGPRYEYEKSYMPDIGGRDHLWIDEEIVVAIFSAGRFDHLELMKG